LAQLGRIAPHLVLYPQCGIERPLRVILMRKRCPEQRKNTIASGLHDIAAVTMDGIDHQLKCWINNRPGLLWVEVLHKLHRTLDIGEESGDRFALAVEDRWCVYFRGSNARI